MYDEPTAPYAVTPEHPGLAPGDPTLPHSVGRRSGSEGASVSVAGGAPGFVPVPPPSPPSPPTPTSSPAPDHRVSANQRRGITALLTAVAIGAGASVALGTYGRLHRATGEAITTFGFPAVLPMKAWLTTAAAALVLVQVASAAWMWDKLPGAPTPVPRGVAATHRWTGTVAFVLTVPVAYHCLWSLGFRTTDTRVLVHSILGCAFYGAFVTKMLLLRSRHLLPWAMPVAGATLAVLLTGLWLTSSLWFFTTVAV